jgi:autotransporter translocation and assembly factor TamB
VWWSVIGILLATLAGLGAWRVKLAIPEQMERVEATLRDEAARYGVGISWRSMRFHPFYLNITFEDVTVRNQVANLPIARAHTVDVSLSPRLLLLGETPVSKIRVRNFAFRFGEADRPILDRIRAAPATGGAIPDILLFDGSVSLGPYGKVEQVQFRMPSARIRDVRFFGTRVTFTADNVTAAVEYPVVGAGSWPFQSIAGDLFVKDNVVSVRRFRAEGPAASIKASGKVDLGEGKNDLKGSGELDIARWIRLDAPGARLAARFVREGNVEFSASLKGTRSDPAGAGKISLRKGRFEGVDAADFEMALALEKRQVRVGSVKGTLWDGAFTGDGSWDLAKKKGNASASLSRAWLGRIPWPASMGGWRPAGQGAVTLSVTGDPDALKGTVSLACPDGIERGGEGGVRERIRLPVALIATGTVAPNSKNAGIDSARLRFGDHEATANGTLDWGYKKASLRGTVASPFGRTADFGIRENVSWRRVAASWGLEGAFDAPAVTAQGTAEGIGYRTFPTIPLSARIEGNLADVVYVVADVAADIAQVTTTATVTGPLSTKPFQVNASVAARDIDFSKAAHWLSAASSPPAFDAAPAVRYLEKLGGRGAADIDLSHSAAETTISGTARTDEVNLRGVSVRSVAVEGSWKSGSTGDQWRASGEGEAAGGAIRLSGSGEGAGSRFKGTLERIDISRASGLLPGRRMESLSGTASAEFSMQVAPNGRIDVPAAHVTIPDLVAGGVSWGTVTGDVNLGAETGAFRLAAASPAIRLSGGISRGEGIPLSFRVTGSRIPTSLIAAVAGKPSIPSDGKWDIEADGRLRAAGLIDGTSTLADSVTALQFRLTGSAPSVSDLAFESVTAEGRKEGDTLVGELRTNAPDGKLGFTVGLREGYPFHAKGPFSFGNRKAGATDEPLNRFSMAGNVEVSGSLAAFDKTTGALHVDQLRYKSGALELAGKDLSAKLGADGIRWAGGTVTASGSPVAVSGKVSWKGELDARIEGKLPAAMVRLVTDVFDRLDGTVSVNIRVSGKVDNPSVVGTGHLEGGVFSFKGYAQLFEEMRADAIISREKIVFEHFDGRSGGGYIDGRGELPLQFDAGQRMFFSVDFLDMRYPYPDDFKPVLQGHAELFGPVESLLVTGDVEIQSARYTRTIRPQKLLLDFKRRLADVTARRQKGDFRVRLDINVVADGTIEIRNNLAKATAKGEFKVAGDTSRVIVLGAFDILEGQIDFQGNIYEVKHLGIDFNDPRRNNPRIDGRAETKKNNYLVTILVTGTLDKYEVDLLSDPPLGKNDIVSLLSLGVTSQSLQGQEGSVGASLGTSIILGPYKGRVEEGIRGLVGLDKLAVEAAFSSVTKSFEPRFIVGKTFGDKLTVSVSTLVGATSDSSANVEFKLLENVFLQGSWQSATTQKTGDMGADIKFKYRYRTFKDFLGGRD